MTTDGGMNMEFIWEKKGWNRLLRRTRDAALDVSEAARSGAELAGQRAGDALACAKLNQAVSDLQEEIDLQMQAVGELIYATHRGTPSDSQAVQEILEYVDGLYEELEGHQQQLKLLRGLLLCGACGAENGGGNVYCHNCGQPLSRG